MKCLKKKEVTLHNTYVGKADDNAEMYRDVRITWYTIKNYLLYGSIRTAPEIPQKCSLAASCEKCGEKFWLNMGATNYLTGWPNDGCARRNLLMYRGADKSLAWPGRKQANVSARMAWISFGALPCRKKARWHFASRCCWNRERPWHDSELVSFLVGLKTYQHPGT